MKNTRKWIVVKVDRVAGRTDNWLATNASNDESRSFWFFDTWEQAFATAYRFASVEPREVPC